MKRIITLCLICLLTINSLAETTIPKEAVLVYLTGAPRKDKTKGHKAPARQPLIFYLDNYLYIQSPYNIEGAQIIISDIDGNILFSTIAFLTSGVNTITLPLEIVSEMDTIEFVYETHEYYGAF